MEDSMEGEENIEEVLKYENLNLIKDVISLRWTIFFRMYEPRYLIDQHEDLFLLHVLENKKMHCVKMIYEQEAHGIEISQITLLPEKMLKYIEWKFKISEAISKIEENMSIKTTHIDHIQHDEHDGDKKSINAENVCKQPYMFQSNHKAQGLKKRKFPDFRNKETPLDMLDISENNGEVLRGIYTKEIVKDTIFVEGCENDEEKWQIYDAEIDIEKFTVPDQKEDIPQGQIAFKRQSWSSICGVVIFTLLLQLSVVMGRKVHPDQGHLCSRWNLQKSNLYLEDEKGKDSFNRLPLTGHLCSRWNLQRSNLYLEDEKGKDSFNRLPLTASSLLQNNDQLDKDLESTSFHSKYKRIHFMRKLNGIRNEIERKERKTSIFEDEKPSLFQLNDRIVGNERTYWGKTRTFSDADISRIENTFRMDVYFVWDDAFIEEITEHYTEDNETKDDGENCHIPNYRLDSRYAKNEHIIDAMEHYDCNFQESIEEYKMVLMSDLKLLNYNGVKEKNDKKSKSWDMGM
ncbi:uncharacterized protein LOC134687978 [Mytilus trossulus]|uniref:uncharacterized protein LOC134687978 n=1 Tax=Mytilus trossulus TaxID=6551 RepID=UPI003004D2D8